MNTAYIEPEGFKGTPGEWRIFHESTKTYRRHLFTTTSMHGDVVAQPPSEWELDSLKYWEANAALLVNAKEMLKELQMLVGRLEALKEGGHLPDSFKLTSSYQVINTSLGLYTETTKH